MLIDKNASPNDVKYEKKIKMSIKACLSEMKIVFVHNALYRMFPLSRRRTFEIDQSEYV